MRHKRDTCLQTKSPQLPSVASGTDGADRSHVLCSRERIGHPSAATRKAFGRRGTAMEEVLRRPDWSAVAEPFPWVRTATNPSWIIKLYAQRHPHQDSEICQ